MSKPSPLPLLSAALTLGAAAALPLPAGAQNAAKPAPPAKGAAPAPLSPAAEAVRKSVQPVYDMLAAAIEKADPAAVISVMNANYLSDYQMTDQNGEKSDLSDAKAKAVGTATADRTGVRSVKLRFAIQAVTLQGQEAVVTVRNVLTAEGTPPANGTAGSKPIPLESSGVKQDTWRKTPQGWRLARTKFLSSEYRVDGKLVPRL